MDRADRARHVLALLRARGPSRFVELERALGNPDRSTFSRWVRSIPNEVVSFGKRRTGVRYAARRAIPGAGDEWPIFAVSTAGAPEEWARLIAIEPGGYLAVGRRELPRWAKGAGGTGVFAGLPFFLQDAAPQGFLGRLLAHRLHDELGLPRRLTDWQEHHVLASLVNAGADTPGHWLVGAAAHDALMQRRMNAPEAPIVGADGTTYEQLASQALADDPPGSSAAGEQPKVACYVRAPEARHVIVKFSPPRDTQVGERWADLLVCEHLAHEVLRAARTPAVKSRILDGPTRRFLEVERFDRVGVHGRRAACSLFAIDAEYFGALDTWPAAGRRLHRRGWLDAEAQDTLSFWWSFSGLIGNTDRHFGNITLLPAGEGFTLAPAYDMLPMLFAPQGSELVERGLEPDLPLPGQVDLWRRAGGAARSFWTRVAQDGRVSPGFRARATECERMVQAALQRISSAP